MLEGRQGGAAGGAPASNGEANGASNVSQGPDALAASCFENFARVRLTASMAALFSLLIAFIVTPWAARRLLPRKGSAHEVGEGKSTRLYRRVMGLSASWAFVCFTRSFNRSNELAHRFLSSLYP